MKDYEIREATEEAVEDIKAITRNLHMAVEAAEANRSASWDKATRLMRSGNATQDEIKAAEDETWEAEELLNKVAHLYRLLDNLSPSLNRDFY